MKYVLDEKLMGQLGLNDATKNMTRETVETYLRARGWSPFYSDNYWIPEGGSDYFGVRPAEAYAREKLGRADSADDIIAATLLVEYLLHCDEKLLLVGKTFELRQELKEVWGAKWRAKDKAWEVPALAMASVEFHRWCYDENRGLRFQWVKAQ